MINNMINAILSMPLDDIDSAGISRSLLLLCAAFSALWVLAHASGALGDGKLRKLRGELDELDKALQSAQRDAGEQAATIDQLKLARQRLQDQITAQHQPRKTVSPVCAKSFRNLDFVTFANHKGGVGKSTLLAWVARFAAEADQGLNVLVLDLSIYGDATRLLLGGTPSSSSGKHKAIEHFVQDSLQAPATVRDYIIPTALSNVFVMPNAAQAGKPLQCLDEISNSAASHVAHALRSDLSQDAKKNGAKWLVLADTDGGICTGYTKLALAAADRIVAPVSANPIDAKRLPVFLGYLEKLLQDRLTNATLTNLVFNAMESRNNKEKTSLSNFKPSAAVLKSMHQVLRDIETMEGSFPLAFATVRSSSIKGIVTSVRKGGKDMCEATNANIFYCNAGNAEVDLKALATTIMAAPTGFGGAQRRLPA